MSDPTDESPSPATGFLHDPVNRRWLATSGVLAIGLVVGGYLGGTGVGGARDAVGAVPVRGRAERDGPADLATWTITYSSSATDLATAQASVDRDSAQIRTFFKELGFPADALQPTGVNVSNYTDNAGVPRFTVRQRMTLRTEDIKRAENAMRRQFDLVRRGVVLEAGSGMDFAFTRLNTIKPAMIAEATKDARSSAEQFARDSGTSVGAIRSASQGYFSITARDSASSGGEEGGGWGDNSSPYKRVRVVTTVSFDLR